MLKSHVTFHSANGKRLVLVAVDDKDAQDYFERLLREEYEVLISSNRTDTEALVRENGDILSLVILHLREPEGVALDLLNMIREDEQLKNIPVIIVGETNEMEIDSLEQGAIDFMPKPYPPDEVVLARITRTIELSEDREIISSTERDPLTGLYNREFFYRYAEQFDHHHKGMAMDAIVLDVNNFSMINERFGTSYGDSVLRRIGERVRDMVRDTGGIVCRREADTFQVYCPHGKTYQAILDNASIGLAGEASASNRIRLRMGVYENVDKSLDIERRFDRASKAADSVRNSFTQSIGMYDSALHDREVREAQLVEEFHQAIADGQFMIHYQPKFDVRGKEPILSSAEALVRWKHPVRGMISPGEFIPLFEENGLIQELDYHIWMQAARQIRAWKDKLGFCVPISVNVSRIDMYDPGMINYLVSLLKQFGIRQTDLLLEITESAYTESSDQIIEMVNKLRDLGFRIEMDDFGSGYSSLNMISTLPIDVLKLDMLFIRTVLDKSKDARMLEIILDIADYLDVPVVAEGVETREQMETVRDMGCHLVQGYYFSRPVPAEEFEPFILERMELSHVDPLSSLSSGKRRTSGKAMEPRLKHIAEDRHLHHVTFSTIAQALSQDYFSIYYVDVETDRYIEYRSYDEHDNLSTEKEGTDFFVSRRKNMVDFVHPDDRDDFLAVFTKENIINQVRKNQIFTHTCRLVFDGTPTYVYMKAIGMEDSLDTHIVIGVSNIDVEIRREQENAEKAMTSDRDILTGVKSRKAYILEEEDINRVIEEGRAEPFALVICDMNGYTRVSRCLGKSVADDMLKTACGIVCRNFDHSPVYRIGDDEFIAILRGEDYEQRAGLMARINSINAENIRKNEVSLAVGMSAFDPATDHRTSVVFERADEEMYRNRAYLQSLVNA